MTIRYTFLLFILALITTFSLHAQNCPQPIITPSPETQCGPLPAVLKVTQLPEYVGYLWSSGHTNSEIQVTEQGTYTVTVTCAMGLTRTNSITMPFSLFNASFDSLYLKICDPGDLTVLNVTVNATGQYNTPPFNVQIQNMTTGEIFNEEIPASGQHPVFITGPNETTYFRIISLTNNLGCPGAPYGNDQIQVQVIFPDPSYYPTIEGDSFFCAGGSTLLSVEGINEVHPPKLLAWLPPPPLQQLVGSVYYQAQQVGGIYQVYINYDNQCSILLQKEVDRIVTSPDITGAVLCSGEPAVLSTTKPFAGYQWSDGATTPTTTVYEPGIYRVTVTDIWGCTGIDLVNVVERDKPSVDIQGPLAICSGQTTTHLEALGFGINFYSWSTGATTSGITVPTGTYTVTVSNVQGCSNVAEWTVVEAQTPTVSLTPPLNKICEGTSITLTPAVTPANVLYNWSNGAQTNAITVNTTGAYGVTVYDETSTCFRTAQTYVQVEPRPAATIVASATTICPQSTASLTASGGTSYLWSNGLTTPTITTGTAGTYSVIVTGQNGCTSVASQTITVAPPLQPVMTGPTTACFGNPVSLSVPGGYASYLWSTGATTPSITTGSSGTYTVVVTDNLGCTGSATRQLTFGAALQPQIQGPLSLCGQPSATLSLLGTFAGYTWNTGDSTNAVVVSNPGTYSVIVSDAQGCTGTTSYQIVQSAPPQPAITGFNSLCQSDSITLTTNAGFSQYVWSNTSNQPSTVVTEAGTYTVQVTDALGCTGVASKSVSPVITLAPAITWQNLCNNTIQINAVNGSFAGYSWTTGASTPSIVAATAGDYTVVVSDNNSCTGSATLAATIPPAPQANISGPSVLCAGNSDLIGVTSSFSQYLWSTGASSASINITGGATYLVTVTDEYGCTATASKNVLSIPNPTPTITGSTTLCSGGTAVLDVSGGVYDSYQWSTGAQTPSITVNNPGAYTVQVSDLDGCTGTATVQLTPGEALTPVIAPQPYQCNGEIVLDAGSGFTAYLWSNGSVSATTTISSSGVYSLIVTDDLGCTGVSTFTLTDFPTNPAPAITGPTTLCADGQGILSLNQSFSAYLWNDGSNAPTLGIEGPGDFSVVVTDQNGCTGSADFTVSEAPPLTPSIEIQLSECPVVLNVPGAYTTYSWSNGGNGASISTTQTGVFSVVVSDENGCTGSVSAEVEQIPALSPTIVVSPYECNGMLTLSVGQAYATYSWSNGSLEATTTITNSGSYLVAVTNAAGCAGTAIATVGIPAAPQVSIMQNIVSQSVIELFANSTPGQYLWSTGDNTQSIQVEVAGTYTVTLTDINGCTATAESTVTFTPPVTVTATITPITCAGGADASIAFCVNQGLAPYTMTLPPSSAIPTETEGPGCASVFTFEGLPAGNYTGIVQDASGAIQTVAILVQEPQAIQGSANVSGSTVTITASGGTGALQYSLNGATFQSSPVFENVPNGTYTPVVSDGNGCTLQLPDVTVMTIGSEEAPELMDAMLIPNPNNGQFRLVLPHLNSGQIWITITDMAGRTIETQQFNATSAFNRSFDLSAQASGLYMLQVKTLQGTATFKVAITR